MASISLRNASVEIPILAVGNNSLKTALLRRAIGGFVGKTGSNLIVSALNNVSLEARDGDRIGLIGQNGAGKTTLLRVLAGVYVPTKGSLRIEGAVSPMFDASLGMTPEATGIENIRICATLWGLSREDIEAGMKDVIEFTELGDYLNIPVRTYSAGMLLRLSFAIATLRRPEILLLDEVIGAGDASFRDKARARMEKMMSRSQILVVSSHSDQIIRTFCNKLLWLDRGNIVQAGDVEEVLAAYKEAMARKKKSEDSAKAAAEAAAQVGL